MPSDLFYNDRRGYSTVYYIIRDNRDLLESIAKEHGLEAAVFAEGTEEGLNVETRYADTVLGINEIAIRITGPQKIDPEVEIGLFQKFNTEVEKRRAQGGNKERLLDTP